MTFLEALIVILLVTVFISQMGGIQSALFRQFRGLVDRAAIDREMRALRMLVLSDLGSTSSLSVGEGGRVNLHVTNPQPADVSYYPSSGRLVRERIDEGKTMIAALYLESADCILEEGRLSASWSFRKGNASSSLSLYQVFVSTS
jgi:hypothetical protein